MTPGRRVGAPASAVIGIGLVAALAVAYLLYQRSHQPPAVVRVPPPAAIYADVGVHPDVEVPIHLGWRAYVNTSAIVDRVTDGDDAWMISDSALILGNARKRLYVKRTALNGLPQARLTAVAVWYGQVFVASDGDGLARIARGEIRRYYFDVPGRNHIVDLATYEDGVGILTRDCELLVFDGSGFGPGSELPDEVEWTVDCEAGRIEDGAAADRPAPYYEPDPIEEPPAGTVLSIAPLANGNVRVTTDSGAADYVPSGDAFLPVDPAVSTLPVPAASERQTAGLPPGTVVTATLPVGDEVLIGTDCGGLCLRAREGGWRRMQRGLPSKKVTALAAAGGTVYVGTDLGLVTIPSAKLDAALDPVP